MVPNRHLRMGGHNPSGAAALVTYKATRFLLTSFATANVTDCIERFRMAK